MPSPAAPSDLRPRLTVETPEHVALDLELAGLGSRAIAATLDTLLIGAWIFAVSALFALLEWRLGIGSRWADAVLLFVLGGSTWGYFTLFEGLRGGQTPGKRAVGIRVVRDTGHPVTLGAAFARNLLRTADFLPPPYLLGAALVLLHPRGKRLGDLVAGTIVVRDRPAISPLARVRAEASLPTIGERPVARAEFELLARFAARAADLDPAALARLAAGLAPRFAAHPAPPGATDAEFLLVLHARELARREGTPAAGDGVAERFAARKRLRWDEFETLADRAARRGLDGFGAAELPDFAARYREIAADLARARTYGADAGTVARLERLAAAGHNTLYRDERRTWRRIWEVLARECPAAVVAARRPVLLAALVFLLPAAGGFLMLRDRPALAGEVLPDVMLERAEAGASRAAEGRRYVTVAAEDRPLMASGIITNNVRVAFACFAGGVFLGVGALVLLAYNGLAIGAAAGHFANVGLLAYLLEFIVGHGALELFAIWVAGAAGFLLGRAAIAPGDRTRADALAAAGRTAVPMLGATVVLLIVAGMIEGFLSAGELGWTARVAASLTSVAFLAVYLANGTR